MFFGCREETTVRFRAIIVSLVLTIAAASTVWAEGTRITADQAKEYIGQTTTVCGTVASAKFAKWAKRKPTFLNLGAPYPKQVFTVVIRGDDRAAFGEPEKSYAGKNICVTGLIKSFRGKPEIAASSPSQIVFGE